MLLHSNKTGCFTGVYHHKKEYFTWNGRLFHRYFYMHHTKLFKLHHVPPLFLDAHIQTYMRSDGTFVRLFMLSLK